LTTEEAKVALNDAVPHFDRYLSDGSVEIVPANEWYLQDDKFELKRVTAAWHEKLVRASAKGYVGVRVTGDTAWLRKRDWNDFYEYEMGLNEAVANQHMAVLCTYPLCQCGAGEVLDVVRTHQFALAKRLGDWDVIETAGVKQAKAEIKRLNEELEARVAERTQQLMLASEALRELQMELAHVNRVSTMGQLAASITHEINQPIAATLANAHAGLRWLNVRPPDLEEVRQALGRIIGDGNRVGEISGRIRDLFKKVPPQKATFEINQAILDVLALTRSEVLKTGIQVETQLAADLPSIEGDRVQLQQVLLNLIINAVEAMSDVSQDRRQLVIGSEKHASGAVVVNVRDSGRGLKLENLDRIFDAFFTTKPDGMGMGLAICRSIIEGHGGQLWAGRNEPRGAVFQFTLPAHAGDPRGAPV
jgi:C4-dicarboxylate-specific signal transduction histidine kinase